MLSPRAESCPNCGDRRGSRGFLAKLAWLVTFLATLPAAALTAWGLFGTEMSAPQQASLFAGAAALVVVPYCFARAVEKY